MSEDKKRCKSLTNTSWPDLFGPSVNAFPPADHPDRPGDDVALSGCRESGITLPHRLPRWLGLSLLVFTMLLAMVTSAHAFVEITNLSDETQQFVIREVGEQQRQITVAPNATWQGYAPRLWIAPIRGERIGKERFARHSDSYTYWPDGTFAIQQRRRLQRGRN